MKVIELKNFFVPLGIERRWEVDNEDVAGYIVYWTPWGDECIVNRVYEDGHLEGGDADWRAFFELEKLNPILKQFDLGSSDTEASQYLLVDKRHNRFYIIPRKTRIVDVLKLLGIKDKRLYKR